MPAALLVQVADAVVAELAAGLAAHAFTRDDFSPARVFDAGFELKDAGLHVEVLPAAIALDLATRAEFTHEIKIDVVIREKLLHDDRYATEAAQIEDLLLLEEQIARYLTADDDAGLAGRRQATLPAAVATGPAEIRVPLVPRHRREWRQFTGILTVTYRIDE